MPTRDRVMLCALSSAETRTSRFVVLIDKKARYVNVGPRNSAVCLTLIALRVRIRPRLDLAQA